MLTLKGETVYLRALEPEDLDFVYEVENDESIWEISSTQTPYSRYLIKQYLENAQQDIYEARQLRLAICRYDDCLPIGLVDLFEFDPKNNRAGVGILIKNKSNRNQGVGTETLNILIQYSFKHLNLHQLFANIDPANEPSVQLFTKFDFVHAGTKKEWNLSNGTYKDEATYQLINN